MAQWIWYYGDYELYHSLLLHERREEYGANYPCFWQLAAVYPRVNFYKTVTLASGGEMTVYVKGSGYVLLDGTRFPTGQKISVPAGEHGISVVVINPSALPAVYVDSDVCPSDGTWYATAGLFSTASAAEAISHRDVCFPVGASPVYKDKKADLSAFPFHSQKVLPVSVAEEGKYTVYDFGKELFGPLSFSADPGEEITVLYGESKEEATSFGNSGNNNALLFETCKGKRRYRLRPRAFRYVSFSGNVGNVCTALTLLPLSPKAKFSCDDENVAKVWDACTYTFRLCAREFFLDGIKRDRWCWAGDAYQSFLVSRYLFGDEEITKRTLLALYGKPPYQEHINTINDYSSLLLIGTWEYVCHSGDTAFLSFLWERITALYGFITGRLDERGYVVPRPGDWIFIDWGELDKTGAVCAEQILLWQACRSMENMAALLGKDGAEYRTRAEKLKESIDRDFWREDKHAYIDNDDFDRAHISRQANIFAILYGFCTKTHAMEICRHVLENDAVPAITTPYFKFYELLALSSLKGPEEAQRMLLSYWAGMLKRGATTVWEEFDPKVSGMAQYSMYGSAFGKSLCHAWGAGPIALLGRFCAGILPTSLGCETFTVAPNPGLYSHFKATFPLRNGTVKVSYRNGKVRVLTDLPGGTLRFGGKEKPIFPGKPCIL